MEKIIWICCFLSFLFHVGAFPPRYKQDEVFREGRIILPQTDGDGGSLLQVKYQLETKLLGAFGGFTSANGIGGWESHSKSGTLELHREPVWIYDIACPHNNETIASLTATAIWMKTEAKQESIYLRLPSGNVLFI